MRSLATLTGRYCSSRTHLFRLVRKCSILFIFFNSSSPDRPAGCALENCIRTPEFLSDGGFSDAEKTSKTSSFQVEIQAASTNFQRTSSQSPTSSKQFQPQPASVNGFAEVRKGELNRSPLERLVWHLWTKGVFYVTLHYVSFHCYLPLSELLSLSLSLFRLFKLKR